MSSAEPSHLAPGARLNGVFEIDWFVAPGRLGDIYRAHAVETGAEVAVKAMRAELAGSALALLRREASALRNVHHEAIVRHYLFSHDPGTGRHYLAMEFVDGYSLSVLMQQGPLGSSAVHVLQERLAAGLDAAHQRGVIHGRLSPGSVLIPAGDLTRAKIISFGAAAGDGGRIDGGVAASNDYAAPEQFGLFGGEATAKSDIYSLGLVFAACLRGRPLDMGRTPLEALEKRRTVPDLREIDRRFRPLLEKMLQPAPADRPESMTAVAAWRPRPETTAPQRDAARGRGESTGPAALPATKALTVVAAALVLLLGVGGAGFYFASDRVSDLVSSWLAASSNPDPLAGKRANELAPASLLDRLAVSPQQRIIEFVNAYDGGDCFFITPEAVEDDNAVLDGLGSSVAPFEILDHEFKRKNGFEPSIGVHQVMAEQCPAVSFLFHTRRQRSAAPRLDASTAGLKEGGPLTGSISNFGDGAIELLLVADDGYVRNLTTLLKTVGSARNFAVGIRKTSPGPPRPQILMAVASSKPLEALKVAPDGTLAGQVFPRALAEASRSGQTLSVSAKYFMLEK